MVCVGWALPRPSEPGEGRLSYEFWNDEERPWWSEGFGFQGLRKSSPPIRSARSCPPLSQSCFLHMQDPFLKRSLAPPRLQGFQSSFIPAVHGLHGPCPNPTHADDFPTTRKPEARSQEPGARSQNNLRHVEFAPHVPTTKPAIGRQRPAWLPRCSIAVPCPASAHCSENRLGLLGPRLALFGQRQVGVQLPCCNLAAQSHSSLPCSS
jgi:hypothetical protein